MAHAQNFEQFRFPAEVAGQFTGRRVLIMVPSWWQANIAVSDAALAWSDQAPIACDVN